MLKSCSQSQAQLTSTLNLQSSSTLGTGKAFTNRERLERLEDKQVRKAVEGRTGKRKRKGDNYAVLLPGEGESEGTDEDMEGRGVRRRSPIVLRETQEEPASPNTDISLPITRLDTSANVAVGSALKRNADGSVVAPIVRKRTGGKKVRVFSTTLTRINLPSTFRVYFEVGRLGSLQANNLLLKMTPTRHLIVLTLHTTPRRTTIRMPRMVTRTRIATNNQKMKMRSRKMVHLRHGN